MPKKGGILRMSIPEKEAVHLKKGGISKRDGTPPKRRYTQKSGTPKRPIYLKRGGILKVSIPEKEAVYLKKGWYIQKGRYA